MDITEIRDDEQWWEYSEVFSTFNSTTARSINPEIKGEGEEINIILVVVVGIGGRGGVGRGEGG